MILIGGKRAVELLEAEVAEAGRNFVYKKDERDESGGVSCKYVEDGCPSCLIGRALHRASVPLYVLGDLDVQNEGMSEAIAEARFNDDIELTADARDVFQAAQSVQDAGGTWGHALDMAKAELAEGNDS
jgi:hypothetical protein